MDEATLVKLFQRVPQDDARALFDLFTSVKGAWIKTHIRTSPLTIEFPSWQLTLYSSDELEAAENLLSTRFAVD